ncbi:MAG: DUF1043 family protein [Pseudomonadales bacterium]|nr:DUF1043 family protein [Pseudomonadales bacterium]NIX09938.1 DUF1043 family protein [Pseudomonadales bacterium]
MYSLAWLVVVGVTAAVIGAAAGYLVAQVRSQARERIRDLEAELDKAQDELAGYRREVFEQFAETARKFKTLDESYSDLHRQLASSASLLCGEAAGPLLAAPDDVPEITAPPQAAGAAGPGHSVPLDSAQAESDLSADVEPPIVVTEAEETATDPQAGEEEPSAAEDSGPPRAREAG